MAATDASAQRGAVPCGVAHVAAHVAASRTVSLGCPTLTSATARAGVRGAVSEAGALRASSSPPSSSRPAAPHALCVSVSGVLFTALLNEITFKYKSPTVS